jgi:hypothetical protein
LNTVEEAGRMALISRTILAPGFFIFITVVSFVNGLCAMQEVREHVIYVEDVEQWWGEVYAGALNPGGPLQGPRLQAGLAYPAGPGRMCFVAPEEAFIAGQGIIFRILKPQTISYFAGSTELTGYQDGILAGALFGTELSICPDGTGGLYVCDRFNRCIRRIFRDGEGWKVKTLAGHPSNPLSEHLLQAVRDESSEPALKRVLYESRSDHDGRGSQATFSYLHSNVVRDNQGQLFVMDADFLRCISSDGLVRTLNPEGGTGNPGPDGEPLKFAHFRLLMKSGIGFGGDGCLYVADRWNHCVRRIDLTAETVTTVIGPGRGYVDGPSRQAGFHDSPGHIIYDPFRKRLHVNGVDDWGLRVWNGSVIKTLAGGNRQNRDLSGPAPEIGFHWGGTHAIDPSEPHAVYFWSNQDTWRGRVGRLYKKTDGGEEIQ